MWRGTFQVVFLHTVAHGVARQSQELCRLRDIPAGLIHGLFHQVTFDLFETDPLRGQHKAAERRWRP